MRLLPPGIRSRLAALLRRWAAWLTPDAPPQASAGSALAVTAAPLTLLPAPVRPLPQPIQSLCPATREPLSVEQAVLGREMTVLRREAADGLAALAAAHALVTSARLAQIQALHEQVREGSSPADALVALVADHQGWQNDQVRLFDALALVLRMRIPQGTALEQVGEGLETQARAHLEALSAEYHRNLLQQQFPSGS